MFKTNSHFHFIGLGGGGMSALAVILAEQGHTITGSDLEPSKYLKTLKNFKVEAKIGHKAENISTSVDLVVCSSAIKNNNPELVAAKERNLKIIKRGELLAQIANQKYGIAVAGSHGKTSVATMIAELLSIGDLSPGFYVGAVSKYFKTGGSLGKSQYFVYETDESDRSFLLANPKIGVLTNVDVEHLEAYQSLDHYFKSYMDFVSGISDLLIVSSDHAKALEISNFAKCKVIKYGFNNEADVRAYDLKYVDGKQIFKVTSFGEQLGEFTIPFPGLHFVQNMLAAIAIALELKVSVDQIKLATSKYQGAERRLDFLADFSGVKYFDDYAHHPVEVSATIQALKEQLGNKGKLIVVFQPHRYTRTKTCFEEYKNAFINTDVLLLMETFSAGEEIILGYESKDLFEVIKANKKYLIKNLNQETLKPFVAPGDYLAFLGAGSISDLARKLIKDE